MITLVFMAIGVLLIVLQTSVFLELPGNFGRPDMIYLLVAFSAYRFAWLPGILLTFTIGWIFDVLVGVNLGVYPLICLFVFSSLKLVAINSPVKSSAYEIPLVGLSYFLMRMITFFFNSLTLEETLLEWSWGGVIRETLLWFWQPYPAFCCSTVFLYILKKGPNEPSRRAGRRLAGVEEIEL